MLFTLLNHGWLSFWRSKTLSRSLATTIFTWIMMGFLLLYVLGFGIMLEKIITKVATDKDPIEFLNGLLLFYWLGELLFRIIIQKNVAFKVQYYLTQRVPSNILSHFMLIKSWQNLFFLITVLLFAPFAFTNVAIAYGTASGLFWLLFLGAISFVLHHFVIAINQIAKGRILLPLIIGLFLIGLIYLQTTGLINLTFLTEQLMAYVFKVPLILLAPLVLGAALYFYDLKLIQGNLSLDSLPERITAAGDGISSWVAYLNSFGIIGQLMALELRLIWRSKRTRVIIISGLVLSLYFIYFLLKVENSPFVGVFMLIVTGGLMINYAQLLFSWESSYFDFLMTRNFSPKMYLTSKFVLLFCFNTLSMIIVSGIIVYINMTLLKDLLVWYLINCGVFIYIFIGGTMLGPKRLDVNARAMFNYEGMNVFNFLIAIPYVLFPGAISYLFKSFLGDNWRDLILFVVGLMGIVFYQRILGFLAEKFKKRKHKILYSFRE